VSELRDMAEAINVVNGLTPEGLTRWEWIDGVKWIDWTPLVTMTCMGCGAINRMCGCGRPLGLFEGLVRAARAIGLP
jgi:hypothetical protein